MKRDRLNVGLFVSNESDDFDSLLIQGALQGAEDKDVNLIVFPGRYINGDFYDKRLSKVEYQYNTLFSYANAQNIDVLLISLGTIGTTLSDRKKKIFLDMYHDIPVMLVASEKKGYPSVSFDNTAGLREGINDLIVNHGCKNIGMVSGPVTSVDAVERLDVYRNTLKENGLEVIEDRIVYGNFSEYCVNEVNTLLDNNKDLDAIVFANDSMAIGGYEAIEMHGLTIGKDILVLGFDNSPATTMLIPNLSSVKADARELGRVGVYEAIEYLKTGELKKIKINTSFIRRGSTGFSDVDYMMELERNDFSRLYREDLAEAARLIVTLVGENNDDNKMAREFDSVTTEFLECFFTAVNNNDNSYETLTTLGSIIGKSLNLDYSKDIDIKYYFLLFDFLKKICNRFFPIKRGLVDELSYKLSEQAAMIRNAKLLKKRDELENLLWMSSSITKDMLLFGEGADDCYLTVVDKMDRLGYKSCFLYTFKVPFINEKSEVWHDWQVPSAVYLKAYFNEPEVLCVPEEGKQEMSSFDIFDNDKMPKDRRYSLIVSNIFINEEQFGLAVFELEADMISYISSINAQLSSAYKVIHMLKLQAGIQKQLELSLQRMSESNKILESISKSDELTGVYNRRGFFEVAGELIKDPINANKKAILIFADMDNLKTVNDLFGHDDGDFSLRAVATILRDSMRTSDIVARIGGDEFAAIAVAEKETDPQVICNRIKTICKKYNENCSKPYYIGISVGYAEFDCSADAEIELYLDMADERLYKDKKNKLKDIMKK